MISGLDIFVPQFIAALLKQTGLSKRTNTIIVLAVYAGWTIISLALGLRGMPHGTPEEFATSFAVAFPAALTVGYAAYKTLWTQVFGEEVLTHATSVIVGPTTDEIQLEPGTEDPGPGEG